MIVLGSTGSIGVNTLKIAKKFNLPIEGLCANQNVDLLNKQIQDFKPKFVAIGHESLRQKVNHKNVFCSSDGILEMLVNSKSSLVVNALVGFAGLKPSMKSINLGKRLALANKESLVVAGNFLDTSKIVPIDSEHFGLKYLIDEKPVSKMTITASGGAFRDTPINQIENMKFSDALKHPNWSMGEKITIDSATMVNKLFELLEARWLFGDNSYDAIIEPSSLIHAFVDFLDGSTTAHFAKADMKLPIAYALLGKVNGQILEHIDLNKIASLEFRKIDRLRYPIWEIKDEILKNPLLGVVINAANEVGIEKFKKDKINIIDLVKLIKKALRKFHDHIPQSIDEIYEIDLNVRKFCQKG